MPADDPPEETADLLRAEMRRRGMSEIEIDMALRKKKRRKVLEFELVKSRHLAAHPINTPAKRVHPPFPADIVTVEEAAARLKLHPKTVLRFIHDGRLAATRLGKSYRIRREDLNALAGAKPTATSGEAAWVTSIVDIPGVGADLAAKWARTVPAALQARPDAPHPMRVDVIHDPDRAQLKVVLTGSPGETAELLKLIQIWIEQLEP